MCGYLSHTPYWGPNHACNPGMCPDWESNWWLFGSQAGAQSTEPHKPGLIFIFNQCLKRCFLRYMTWCFDIHIHCGIIITIKLINTSITSQIIIIVIRTLKVYSLGNFKSIITVSLTTFTLLNIRSPERIHLAYLKLFALWPTSPHPSLPTALVQYSPLSPIIFLVLKCVLSGIKVDTSFLWFI